MCWRCYGGQKPDRYVWSILRLQARFVLGNKRLNLIGHVQKFQPLLFIQRHWKASHSVNRDGTLFTYLHADALGSSFLESIVLSAKTFEFSFQVIIGHGN